MNSKYLEHILIFSLVLFGCLILGSVARIFAIKIGTDSFTSNTIFWIFILLGIIVYVLIVFFIESLYLAIIRFFFKKKYLTQLTNKKSKISEKLEKIRTEQQVLNHQNSQHKQKIAIQYTQKEFAAFCSNKDLNLLCRYLILYSEKKPLQDIKPITINGLSNLDFYHFGWNIWKHFEVSKQEEISFFLKTVFANYLKDIEIATIKSHLRDDERQGIIKIKKNLT